MIREDAKLLGASGFEMRFDTTRSGAQGALKAVADIANNAVSDWPLPSSPCRRLPVASRASQQTLVVPPSLHVPHAPVSHATHASSVAVRACCGVFPRDLVEAYHRTLDHPRRRALDPCKVLHEKAAGAFQCLQQGGRRVGVRVSVSRVRVESIT